MNETIAGYEILEALGGNAWGDAFRARQVSLDRTVYFTLFDDSRLSRSAEALARACAGITHPHLVSGIDFGELDGRRYLVTEWVDGPSVGDLVRRGGAVAEERALEIALAAAQGLDYAGRKGIVHGNLNPEAIVITSGGNPKIRGFGADRESARCVDDYRSPEQKRGSVTGVASDIYSLGLVLHFLLGGEFPFEGAPPPEVVGSDVIEVPCPLTTRTRRMAPETIALVERMTAHAIQDRFPDGAALSESVEKTIEKVEERVRLSPGRNPGPAARPASTRGRSPRRRRRRR